MPRHPKPPFIQLATRYWEDPKIVAAGERAEVLYVRALCWTKEGPSDGFVPARILPRFGLTTVHRRADALVDNHLWLPVDNGWAIVNWAAYNEERRAIEKRLRSDRERKARKYAAGKISPKRAESEPQTAPEQGTDESFPGGIQTESERNPDGFPPLTGSYRYRNKKKTSSSSRADRAMAAEPPDDDSPSGVTTEPPAPTAGIPDDFPLPDPDGTALASPHGNGSPDRTLLSRAWRWLAAHHPEQAGHSHEHRSDYVAAVLTLGDEQLPDGPGRFGWQAQVLGEYLAELRGKAPTARQRRRLAALVAEHGSRATLKSVTLAAGRADGGLDRVLGYAATALRKGQE